MIKIDNLPKLFGIVQQELKNTNKPKNKTVSSFNNTNKKLTLEEFSQTVSTRIEQLENKNLEQATLVFVKSILAWEFGYEILNDSAHLSLAEKISKTLQEDVETRKTMKQLFNC